VSEAQQHFYKTITDIVQLQRYLELPQNGKVIAEYVWIDSSNGVRSKCKVSLVTYKTNTSCYITHILSTASRTSAKSVEGCMGLAGRAIFPEAVA